MTFYRGSTAPTPGCCDIGDIFHHEDDCGSMGYFRVQCEVVPESLSWAKQWIKMHLIKELV